MKLGGSCPRGGIVAYSGFVETNWWLALGFVVDVKAQKDSQGIDWSRDERTPIANFGFSKSSQTTSRTEVIHLPDLSARLEAALAADHIKLLLFIDEITSEAETRTCRSVRITSVWLESTPQNRPRLEFNPASRGAEKEANVRNLYAIEVPKPRSSSRCK